MMWKVEREWILFRCGMIKMVFLNMFKKLDFWGEIGRVISGKDEIE